MELKETFDEVIEDYDFARPKYPSQLNDDIIEYSAINKSSRILEVGAGTGQATDYYAESGYDITALEIGEEQVTYLKKKYSKYNNVEVLCEAFEKYNINHKFDLIFSATAFHWIKPEYRYMHTNSLLKSDGTLAIYWVTSLNRIVNSDIHIGVQKICKECVPNTIVFYPSNYFVKVRQFRSNEIHRSGYFKPIYFKDYEWDEVYSAKRYASLINTFEYIQILPQKQRNNLLNKVENFINENGGSILIPQKVELYLIKKK